VRALPHPPELEKVASFAVVVVEAESASYAVADAIREMSFYVRRCWLL
jgi:hypothetical protein